MPFTVLFGMFDPPSPTQDLMVSVILSASRVKPSRDLAKDLYVDA
jgi:hypothetical protein